MYEKVGFILITVLFYTSEKFINECICLIIKLKTNRQTNKSMYIYKHYN